MSWQRLSPRSLGASSVRSLAVAAPVAAVLARILHQQEWTVAATVAACAGAAALAMAAVLAHDALRLRATRWRLTGDRLELRSGVAVRQHRSVPRDRVRSVDLRADLVRRVFGLTVVKVGTGEHVGERAELTLDALSRREGEALRRALLPGGPPAEAPPGRRDHVLSELRWSWIRYAPLSVWAVAGGPLLAGALYKPLDALGVDLVSKETALVAWQWASGRPWVAVPLLAAGCLALGVGGALALWAESWGRYRLEREPGRLRLSRGLLTSRSLTLEERRLRGVELREPLLLRLGGGARVKAVATGLGKAEEGETEDVAALTPPLPRAEAVRVAARIACLPAVPGGTTLTVPGGTTPVLPGGGGPGGMVAEPVAHPRAARRRRVVWALAYVAMVAGAAWLLSWPGPGDRPGWLAWAEPLAGWPWLAPVLALPIALWLAADAYRGLGHGLDARHLVTRHGALVRRTVALDRGGIVGWTITQSPAQRRAGLLTVTATTAAGDGRYDVLDVGHADGLGLAARAVPGLLEPFLVRTGHLRAHAPARR